VNQPLRLLVPKGPRPFGRIEGTYLAVDTCSMAKKPEPTKPIIWIVFLGIIEAPDEAPASERADPRQLQLRERTNEMAPILHSYPVVPVEVPSSAPTGAALRKRHVCAVIDVNDGRRVPISLHASKSIIR
jgi:hypothetical protein